jgi:hypothetical protein
MTLSDLETIKTKIAALLKMSEANGASENEANSAMAFASKLMEEHGITLNDLKTNSKASKDFSFDKPSNYAGKMHIIDQMLTFSIANFTDTICIKNTRQTGFGKNGRKTTETVSVFYGYRVDVELAKYIYQVCKNAMEAEWSKYAENVPQGHRHKQRKNFLIGMASRLRDRLNDIKEKSKGKGTELVVLKRQLIEVAFEEKFKNIPNTNSSKKIIYRDGSAFLAGKEAGDKVNFNKEIYDGPSEGVKLIA